MDVYVGDVDFGEEFRGGGLCPGDGFGFGWGFGGEGEVFDGVGDGERLVGEGGLEEEGEFGGVLFGGSGGAEFEEGGWVGGGRGRDRGVVGGLVELAEREMEGGD